MIVTFLIQLVSGLVSGLLGLVPAWNIDTSVMSSFTADIGGLIGRVNGYVPSVLLMACLGLLLVVKLALLAWRVCVFVYSMIPLN